MIGSLLSMVGGAKVKLMIGVAILGIVGTALFAARWYYNDTQERLAQNAAMITALEFQSKSQQNLIAQQQNDAKQNAAINSELNVKFAAAREEVNVIEGKFNKVSNLLGENRFEKLLVAKPELMTKVVNKGTVAVGRCFEILSGQPRTEDELAAEKPSQYNSACAEIANPKSIELNNAN